jgi:hypothetical protein
MRRKLAPLHAGDAVVLRRLALGPGPPKSELNTWIPVHYLGQVVGSYLRSRDKRAFVRVSESQVRTFLLLVAEDITRTTS